MLAKKMSWEFLGIFLKPSGAAYTTGTISPGQWRIPGKTIPSQHPENRNGLKIPPLNIYNSYIVHYYIIMVYYTLNESFFNKKVHLSSPPENHPAPWTPKLLLLSLRAHLQSSWEGTAPTTTGPGGQCLGKKPRAPASASTCTSMITWLRGGHSPISLVILTPTIVYSN